MVPVHRKNLPSTYWWSKNLDFLRLWKWGNKASLSRCRKNCCSLWSLAKKGRFLFILPGQSCFPRRRGPLCPMSCVFWTQLLELQILWSNNGKVSFFVSMTTLVEHSGARFIGKSWKLKENKNKEIWPKTQKKECGPLWKRFSILDQSLKLFLKRNCINVIQMSPLALPRIKTLIRKKVRQNKAVQSKWEFFNQDLILLISRLKVCHVYIQYGFKRNGFSTRALLSP